MTALTSNYRPISLLSLCSKILEIIIHNKWNTISGGTPFTVGQTVWLPLGSSTQEAILTAVKDWHDILESGGSVACVFLDLSKAFDSHPHDLIVNCLLCVGVCGILHSWFVSFLANRKQRVVLDGFSSDTVKVTSGVPQGSILGPLLFILSVDNINCLPISRNSSLSMYADDIAYWREIRCNEDVVRAQSDLNMISDEIEAQDLRLNT